MTFRGLRNVDFSSTGIVGSAFLMFPTFPERSQERQCSVFPRPPFKGLGTEHIRSGERSRRQERSEGESMRSTNGGIARARWDSRGPRQRLPRMGAPAHAGSALPRDGRAAHAANGHRGTHPAGESHASFGDSRSHGGRRRDVASRRRNLLTTSGRAWLLASGSYFVMMGRDSALESLLRE